MAQIDGTPLDDFLVGTPQDDIIRGFAGNDEINARGGNDFVDGGTGADDIFGRAGNDILFGNDGADDLFGGAGRDRLRGGLGNDVFHFAANEEGKANRDVIQDWDFGGFADFIDLGAFNINFNALNFIDRGDNTLITIEGTNFSLIVKDTDPGQFTAGDFFF